MVRPEPHLSATDPIRMAETPHTRFWMAKASENTSRPQPWTSPMGCMNRPKVARTPIANSSTSDAQTTMFPERDDGIDEERGWDGMKDWTVETAGPVRARPATACAL